MKVKAMATGNIQYCCSYLSTEKRTLQRFLGQAYICLRQPHKSKRYYRFYLPVKAFKKILGNSSGWFQLKIYIEDVGAFVINRKIEGKSLGIFVPKSLEKHINPDRRYRIYLLEAIEIADTIERHVTIDYKNNRAFIDVPLWFLNRLGIPKRRMILKAILEYDNGKRKITFTTYKGKGHATFQLPVAKRYPHKVVVRGVSQYSIKDFVNDFEKLKPKRYSNIKLVYDDGLKLIVDGFYIKPLSYEVGTRTHKVFLKLKLGRESKPVTIYVLNSGEEIEVYRILGSKYFPLETMKIGDKDLVVAYRDKRTKKCHISFAPIVDLKVDNNAAIQIIGDVKIVNSTDEEIVMDVTLNSIKWSNFLAEMLKRIKEWYMGKRSTNYHYYIAKFGEDIILEFLVKYMKCVLLRRNNHPSEHGPDLEVYDSSCRRMIIEVKTTTSLESLNQALREAVEQARGRIKYYHKYSVIAAAVYVSKTENKCKIILRKIYN